MVFASHFRQPLPRWADEGGATSVEHASEKNKHRTMLNEFLRTGRGIAFNQMFTMTEYPQDIMPLYAEGYSLAEFLIQTGGRRKYVEFLGDGLKSDDWSGAVQRHYGIQDLGALQETWLAWVRQGSPLRQVAAGCRPDARRQCTQTPARAKSDLPHSRQAVASHAAGGDGARPHRSEPCKDADGVGQRRAAAFDRPGEPMDRSIPCRFLANGAHRRDSPAR